MNNCVYLLSIWTNSTSTFTIRVDNDFVSLSNVTGIIWLAVLIVGLIFHSGALSSLMLQRSLLLSFTQLLITTNIAFDLYFSLRYLANSDFTIPDYLWLTPLFTIPLGTICAWHMRTWRKTPPCCEGSDEAVIPSHRPPTITSWYWALATVCLVLQISTPTIVSFFVTGVLALLSLAVYRFSSVYQTQTITLQSIKNSYELLTDGLMFFNNEGQPLTINQTMSTVLERLDLAPNSTIQRIWVRLIALSEKQQSHIQTDNNIAVHSDDGQWWYFSKQAIDTSPNVIELRVSECTNYIDLLDNIELRQEDLKQSINQVKSYLAKLEDFEKEKLLLQTRAQLHDVLSQRITVIRRSLEDGVHDGERLREIIHLLEHIEDELLSFDTDDLHQALLSLINSFKHNELRITVDGDLPTDPEIMKIWIAIIREAATNAILHGDASELNVACQEFASAIRLIISNNGTTKRFVREGTGISGIRDRLKEVDGTLTIQTHPIFALIVKVPLTKSAHIPTTSAQMDNE